MNSMLVEDNPAQAVAVESAMQKSRRKLISKIDRGDSAVRYLALRASVRALLRRTSRNQKIENLTAIGPYVVDTARPSVSLHSKTIELATRESDVAANIFANVRRVIYRDLLGNLPRVANVTAPSVRLIPLSIAFGESYPCVRRTAGA
ncbi:response regulator transcription factor [Paraburkholderia sp. SG-MS1]|uniref:response regulator transcription factor n=1 Tax=Paraburkholderia sp. SG-MS1 TaxID=2023741 RepID=UPI001447CC96|nr:response regulator transcription factor [Paraburkholderia sp. SG-MS1]